MATPPTGPWHRRYWVRYNRPYTGCGCLYAIIIVVLIWWILTWFYPGAGWW